MRIPGPVNQAEVKQQESDPMHQEDDVLLPFRRTTTSYGRGAMSSEDDSLRRAAEEYVARYTGAKRPEGVSGKHGIWTPTEDERRPCCSQIKPPHKGWPIALLKHCGSAEHVANLFGVDHLDLVRATREAVRRHKAKVGRKGPTLALPSTAAARRSVIESVAQNGTITSASIHVLRIAEKLKSELEDLERGVKRGEVKLPTVTPLAGELDYWLHQHYSELHSKGD